LADPIEDLWSIVFELEIMPEGVRRGSMWGFVTSLSGGNSFIKAGGRKGERGDQIRVHVLATDGGWNSTRLTLWGEKVLVYLHEVHESQIIQLLWPSHGHTDP